MIVYMVWVFIVPEILDKIGDGWWAVPLTLSQIIPLVFVARAMIRFVDRCDELMKLVYMKSAVTSLIIFTFVCMGYGFLEFRGYPSIPLFLIGDYCNSRLLYVGFYNQKEVGWKISCENYVKTKIGHKPI